MTARRVTARATPIDLRGSRRTSEKTLASTLHPAYGGPVGRLPRGRQVFRGIPFAFAASTARRPWLLLDREVVIDLRGARDATHVVVAHFCDAWRDPVAGRPDDLPVGWVTPVGQPLGQLHGRARIGTHHRAGRAAPVRDQRRDRRVGPGGLRRGAPSDGHAARLARATPGARTGGLRRAGSRRSARDPAGELGSGPDRGLRLGAEPDGRHRVLAADDRDPARSGGEQRRRPPPPDVAARRRSARAGVSWSVRSPRSAAAPHRSPSSPGGPCASIGRAAPRRRSRSTSARSSGDDRRRDRGCTMTGA